jgi:hypothetical protein
MSSDDEYETSDSKSQVNSSSSEKDEGELVMTVIGKVIPGAVIGLN